MSSTTIPLIRAATEGDAEAVRALLAEGADVDESTPRGETALIRAAFFGHADVVRVLLEAGADARRKDSLGITALEWSVRRDTVGVTRILRDVQPPNGAESRRPNKVAQEPQRSDAEAGDAVLELGHAEPTATAVAAADSILELDFTEPPPPAPRAAPAELFLVHDEVEVESNSHEGETASYFDAPGTFVEEAGEQAEEETPARSFNEAQRDAIGEKIYEPAGPAFVIKRAAKESPQISGVKRCARCNSTYESNTVHYCAYHPAKLISTEESAPAIPSTLLATENTRGMRPWTLVLVALMFIVGGLIGHLISSVVFPPKTSYLAQTAIPLAHTALAGARPTQPIVGGAIKGKEMSLAIPEYPEKAKGQGVAGEVTVSVSVNKRGEVISARVLNGHALLRASALKAAREAKFSPEKMDAGRANESGTITYNFQL